MNKIYEVLKPISSNFYQRDFQPGEVIDLTFASDADCLALLASGAVKETTKKMPVEAKKSEVANG